MNEHGHMADPAAQDPARLEREIDRTRASLGRTVDELEQRLSPGELLDQALGMAREHGGQFASNLGRSVRDNPMPLILTGVGIAWMMTSSNEPGTRTTYAGETRYGIADRARAARDSVKDGVSSAKSTAGALGERAAHAGDAVKRSVHNLGDSASEAGARARMQSQRLRSGFERLLDEQPLVVGAIGVALGAALGAAFPRTESEDRLFGESSDAAKRSVKQTAAEAYGEVKEAAAEALESTRESAAHPGGTQGRQQVAGQQAGQGQRPGQGQPPGQGQQQPRQSTPRPGSV